MNVFVGKRQSGKSTWAVKQCAELCSKGYDARIVCMSAVAARHLKKLATSLELYIGDPIPAGNLYSAVRYWFTDDTKQVLILDELTYLPRKTVALAFSAYVVWGCTINME